MALSRSQLSSLTAPERFYWATGIEDTFITDPWPATGRTLDEYELTDHYSQWREDIDLIAQLGVKTARYGVPWHCVNPSHGRWNWDWTDRVLEHILDCGIDPIIDLVHYGTPAWIEQGFLNPDFPEYMAEYAARLAERFKGRIHAYTPLNEPRIAAWYCGKLGWWPPYKRGWRGFFALVNALSRGIVRTQESLLEVDNEIIAVHVDATDIYTTTDPSLKEEVERRQQIVFLALDLVTGRVNDSHPLFSFLVKNGFSDEKIGWFQDHTVELDILGINMYPMYSLKEAVRTSGGMRLRMPYAPASIIEQLGTMYWERYRRPIMIAETASAGSVSRRIKWLNDSVASVATLRERGVPVIGYTWWPLFALVGWAYRQNKRELQEYFLQMGLWNIDTRVDGTLDRVYTPVVDAYREMVSGGSRSVGALALAGVG
jgi:beta-glucosidase/6-phospho-beta-glucosidase/beta-galactosidase